MVFLRDFDGVFCDCAGFMGVSGKFGNLAVGWVWDLGFGFDLFRVGLW